MSLPPLKFCMVTTFYPPYFFGGDGMFIYRLSNALAELGHQVDVVHCIDAYNSVAPRGAQPNEEGYPHHPNVTVHRLKSKAGILSPLITQQTGHPGFKNPQLQAILEQGQYDVINFHNMSLIGPKALSYGSAIKLYTMHEHWLVCPMHVLWKYDREPCVQKSCLSCTLHGKRPPQLWRYTGYLDSMLSNIDAFIAVSQFSRQKHLDMGLKADAPIEHIPYFVPQVEPAISESHGQPTHPRPYFLFVGRLEKMKGVQVLIDAFKKYPNADLLVVGDGNYESELRRQAADVANVQFLGRMPYDQLQPLIRDSVAMLVSSIGYETLGIVILEAFQQSTPAIVNNLGPLPEIIEQSEGGIVYSDESELLAALNTLQTDPAKRQKLGEQGRDAYGRYWSPQAHLPKYLGLVERIAREKGVEFQELAPEPVTV